MNKALATVFQKLPWRDTPWGAASPDLWRSSLRIAIGMCLALAVAFYFQLQQPYWSMATVAVLRQSTTGSLLTRSLARIVATVVGGVMAMIIAGWTMNEPWLLVFCAASWLALVSYVSSIQVRDNAYGIAIMGYTSSLVLFSSINSVGLESLYYTTNWRISEVIVGIVCSALMLAIMPDSSNDKLKLHQALSAMRSQLLDHAIEMWREKESDKAVSVLLGFVGRIMSVNLLRVQALWGNLESRRNKAVLNYLMHLLFRMHSQLTAMRRFFIDWEEKPESLRSHVREYLDLLKQPEPCRYQVARVLAKMYPDARNDHRYYTIWERLQHFQQLQFSYLRWLKHLNAPQASKLRAEPPKGTRVEDIIEHKQAGYNALRTFAVIVVSCAFVIGTQWDKGSSFMSLAAMMCIMFCTRPYPHLVIAPAIKAILVLAVFCFFFKFLVLVHVYDLSVFLMLLFPLLVTMKLLEGLAEPKNKAFILFLIVMLGSLLMITDPPVYDVQSYLNSVLAMSLGPCLALLSFALIQPHKDKEWGASIIDIIRRQFSGQLRARPRMNEEHFAAFIYQHVNLALQRKDMTVRKWVLRWGVVMINVDHVLWCLRRWHSRDPVLQEAKRQVMAEVSKVIIRDAYDRKQIDELVARLKAMIDGLVTHHSSEYRMLASMVWRLRCALLPLSTANMTPQELADH
nr:FUSC family protein [Vibrio sp. V39_P1S14PM300]